MIFEIYLINGFLFFSSLLRLKGGDKRGERKLTA
jgi:hypothetical protein